MAAEYLNFALAPHSVDSTAVPCSPVVALSRPVQRDLASTQLLDQRQSVPGANESSYKAVIVSPEQAFRIMMELGEP